MNERLKQLERVVMAWYKKPSKETASQIVFWCESQQMIRRSGAQRVSWQKIAAARKHDALDSLRGAKAPYRQVQELQS